MIKKLLFLYATVSMLIGIGYGQQPLQTLEQVPNVLSTIEKSDKATDVKYLEIERSQENGEQMIIDPILAGSDSEYNSSSPASGSRAMWDIVFRFYGFENISSYGIATDGNYIYVTSFNSAVIMKFEMDGTQIEVFQVPGVSNLRGLTYDGTYFYGSPANNSIYKMDFDNQTLIGTINAGSGQVCRHLCYDPELNNGNGGFWHGNWSNIRAIDMAGNQLVASIEVPDVAGSGYDPHSDPNNPCLWLYTQQQPDMNTMRQWDIKTRSFTGVSYNVHPDILNSTGHTNGIANDQAGGAFCYERDGKLVIAALVQYRGSQVQVIVYEIAQAYDTGAPEAVENLIVTPNASGGMSANFSWTNPTLTVTGEELTAITSLHIYENDGETPIHTVTNPEPGATGTYTVTGVAAIGLYKYTVVCTNSSGKGREAIASVWIGPDVPAAPTDFNVDVNSDSNGLIADLSWTAPSTGLHGGYFTTAGLVYDVYRFPDNSEGVLVSENQSGVTYSEPIAEEGTKFRYKVIAKNAQGEGGSATSELINFCYIIDEFPWEYGFENPGEMIANNQYSFPACWEVEFLSTHNRIWYITPSTAGAPTSTPDESSWKARIQYNSTSFPITKLITPPIDLSSVEFPVLSFYHTQALRSLSGKWDNLKVYYRTSAFGEWIELAHFTEQMEDWREEKIGLPNPSDDYYIAFEYNGLNGNGIQLDAIQVLNLPGSDGACTALYGNPTPMADEPFMYKVRVTNARSETLTGYTVHLKDEEGNILGSTTDGPDIPPTESALVGVKFTPATTGELTIYAEFDLDEDDNPNNDKSPTLALTVQDWNSGYIGDIGAQGTGFVEPYCPWSFAYNNSIAQSLYLDHEIIATDGYITEINYYTYFTSDFTAGKHVEIWMANTNLTRLDEWVPASEFTKVFDGVVSFPRGKNTISIAMTEPFLYMGGNLVIMTDRPTDNNLTYFADYFYTSNEVIFPGRTRYHRSYDPFNWEEVEGTLVNNLPNITFTVGLEIGSVSGTVTTDGTTPLAGATVQIAGSSSRVTDANGQYSFNTVITGDRELTASKFEYFDVVENAEVFEGQNTVVDFNLSLLPKYTLSGKVTDLDDLGLSGVSVTLTGYHTFRTTTDASGNYSIPDVYGGGKTYTISAELEDYETYTGTIEVSDTDVVYPDIALNDIPNPVYIVWANQSDDRTQAIVTWTEPAPPIVEEEESPASKARRNIDYRLLPDGTISVMNGGTIEDAHTLEFTDSATDNVQKSLRRYEVFRFPKDTPEENWGEAIASLSGTRTYIDNDWKELERGYYNYAVKARYSNDVLSAATLSNDIASKMEHPVSVSVKTNTGTPASGAVVRLYNIQHAHTIQLTGDTGTFDYVFEGTYTLSVRLDGFETYIQTDIVVDDPLTIPEITLIETIKAPFGLDIEVDDCTALLSWNNYMSKTYILDDGKWNEATTSFTRSWKGNYYDVEETGRITGAEVYAVDGPSSYYTLEVSFEIFDANRNSVDNSEPFILQDRAWSGAMFETAVPFSGSFYAMVSWPEHAYEEATALIAMDWNSPYANDNIDWYIREDGEWLVFHQYQDLTPSVFMIRVHAEVEGGKKVTYEYPLNSPPSVEYVVYLDGNIAGMTTETDFTFVDVKKGTHTAGVKAFYSTGESEIVEIEFESECTDVGVETIGISELSPYPNPFSNEINISNSAFVKSVQITNAVGQKVKETIWTGKAISVGELSNGVYFITIESVTGEKTVYKMIKE